MPHETSLIATIVLGLAAAFIGGLVANRLRLPPLIGYLLAGIAIGPYSPGFVADTAVATELAELGIILLMFGVGLHFSLADLLAVRAIAVPGALVQIGLATALGWGLAQLWGWSTAAGLVFGLALSVASTVVLLRALAEREQLDSLDGRIAVGWLIVEDLAMVLALVLLPTLAKAFAAGPQGTVTGLQIAGTILFTLGKVGAFAALMLLVGKRVIPWLLSHVSDTGSRELFTLTVLATALGIAYGAATLFDVSFALGAFFAGMAVSGSDFGHQAAEEALPLQDAFAVLFFVSVGMLFDPGVLVSAPLKVLGTVGIIVVGKALAAIAIIGFFKYSLRTALTIAASLAQIGEFSFILAGLGVSFGLLPEEGRSLILASAIVSITLNPFIFEAVDRLECWLIAHPRWYARLVSEDPDIPPVPAGGISALRQHAVLVGYGRVGRAVGVALQLRDVPFVVVEQERQRLIDLRVKGIPAIYGDAARPSILQHAALGTARLLIVAMADPQVVRSIVQYARRTHPQVHIIARTHSEDEQAFLETHGANRAIYAEAELARAMAQYALEDLRRRPRPAAGEDIAVARRPNVDDRSAG